MRISKIEGIGPVYASKLAKSGIRTTNGLLKAASHRQGRRELAKQTDIPEKQILEWVNLADLMRVRGVGEEYSDLLESAGVDTTRELRTRRPENLHKTLVYVNTEKGLVNRLPSLSEVERWVEEAKRLVPMVTH